MTFPSLGQNIPDDESRQGDAAPGSLFPKGGRRISCPEKCMRHESEKKSATENRYPFKAFINFLLRNCVVRQVYEPDILEGGVNCCSSGSLLCLL